jgi:hypothetical protein
MSAKESPMPPAKPEQPTASEKRRAIHREQVNLVRESLRAGVVYTRPGRVGKPGKRI